MNGTKARMSMNRLFRVFLQGLAVTLPVVLTLYILYWLGGSAETLLRRPLEGLLGDEGPWRYRTGMGLAAAVVAVFLIGLMTFWLPLRRLLDLFTGLLDRVPLVKSLYGGLRDLMHFVSRSRKDADLSQVVIATVAEDCRMLGFVTRRDFSDLPGGLGLGPDRVAVYLPMSYQLGGYTVFVSPERVEPVDMSIEDGFRFAMTAGVESDAGRSRQRPPGEGPEERAASQTEGDEED